ncbi:MAG TPA: tetratricopeptide repeat protein [Candidatus Limnocylindrales bacterium]|nr:tetratricopeptide repeat protein [Candidatus Limnocylindrales bacterium]
MIEALLQAERLLVHGMVDQAEQIYARAVAQDPRNAIAVVGLARVALERGDEQAAYARSREALGIDPQNAAAQRLEARLAEVFAARARQAPPPAPAETSPPAERRPSEQSFLTRNPSMAEHRDMEQRRDVPRASPPGAREAAEQPPPSERRPGLWRRILGE